jgi:hypothetical protein
MMSLHKMHYTISRKWLSLSKYSGSTGRRDRSDVVDLVAALEK